jgi:ATP-dependent Clp protease ATP-binding subunit ClpA
VKLLRRTRRPSSRGIGPAHAYLAAGAAETRRLGHAFIGTEHVLALLIRDPDGEVARLLDGLGVRTEAVDEALACWLRPSRQAAKIDPEALAHMGIDLDAVRECLERTFGPGALERSPSSCLGISPRLKLALASALDHAAGRPLGDVHVLLGMLSVPDAVAAHVLRGFGVTLEAAAAAARGDEAC